MTVEHLLSFSAAFGVMTLIGYLIADLLLPAPRFSGWLAWAFAPVIGAGACSFIIFVFRRPMFTIETVLLVALSAAWIRRHGSPVKAFSSFKSYRVPLSLLAISGVAGYILSVCLQRLQRIPHGGWDGWAIWNSHSRYLYRDGQQWHLHIQNTYHGDYPLLLPLNVSRIWRYAGTEVADLAGLFSILFAFSGIALLGAVLAGLRKSSMGMWTTLLLLTTPYFMIQVVFQEADVPLSIFFMAAIGSLSLYFDEPGNSRGALVLAGFMAGCAAWTKNEGLLFILALSVALLFPIFWKPRATLQRYLVFSAGLVLPLAINIFFKLTIAPENDLGSNRAVSEAVEKILNVSRHEMIFDELIRLSWTFGGWAAQPMVPLAAFLALKGVDRRMLRSPAWWTGLATLGIVLAGYYWVYVLTPMDLRWHLDTSMRRLLLHLWPTLLLLIGMVAAGDRNAKPLPAGPDKLMTPAGSIEVR